MNTNLRSLILLQRTLLALVAGLVTSLDHTNSHAASAQNFYRGKTISIIVPFSPGGKSHLYSQLTARHIAKYWPGHPKLITKNMPGSRGLKATSYLYNDAPKDGTYLGMIQGTLPVLYLARRLHVKADPFKFQYIGRIATMSSVLFVRSDVRGTTIEEARKHQIGIGAIDPNSLSYMYPILLNRFAGTKFRVITGYKGSTGQTLALERGETEAYVSSWPTRSPAQRRLLKRENIVAMVRIGPGDLRGISPEIPKLRDVGKSSADREALAFISQIAVIGRAFVAPPSVPKDRIDAMRNAFDKMVADPGFKEEAKKRRLPLAPMSGQVLQRIVVKLQETPRKVIYRIREALSQKK